MALLIESRFKVANYILVIITFLSIINKENDINHTFYNIKEVISQQIYKLTIFRQFQICSFSNTILNPFIT